MCKYIYSMPALVFLFALSIGIGAAYVADSGGDECKNYQRYGGIEPGRRFFSMQEARAKVRREVRYAKPTQYRSRGRVISIDMVDAERFFAIVYWDESPEDGKPALRYYDKETYELLVEEL
jgi:hypothetical protein